MLGTYAVSDGTALKHHRVESILEHGGVSRQCFQIALIYLFGAEGRVVSFKVLPDRRAAVQAEGAKLPHVLFVERNHRLSTGSVELKGGLPSTFPCCSCFYGLLRYITLMCGINCVR